MLLFSHSHNSTHLSSVLVLEKRLAEPVIILVKRGKLSGLSVFL